MLTRTRPIAASPGLILFAALAAALSGCLSDAKPFDCADHPQHSRCAADAVAPADAGPDGGRPPEADATPDVTPVDAPDSAPRERPDAMPHVLPDVMPDLVRDAEPAPAPDAMPDEPDAMPDEPDAMMPEPDAMPDEPDAMVPEPDAMPPEPDAMPPEPGCAPDLCDPQSDRPFCDLRLGRCVGCGDDDAHCPDDRPVCLGDRCGRCDPIDHRGCDLAGARPFCDPVRQACVGCGDDDARCLDPGRPYCVAGACQPCEVATGAGCAADRPVCVVDGGAPACRGCEADAECAGQGGGGQCVDGRCVACDPADHAGCGLDALCCDDGGAPRCRATDPQRGCAACGLACGDGGDACVDRQCVCGPGLSCAGETVWRASDRPIRLDANFRPGFGDLGPECWRAASNAFRCFGRTTLAHRGQTLRLDVTPGEWRAAEVGALPLRYRSEAVGDNVWRLSIEPAMPDDPRRLGMRVEGLVLPPGRLETRRPELALDGTALSHLRLDDTAGVLPSSQLLLVPAGSEDAPAITYDAVDGRDTVTVAADGVRLPLTLYVAVTHLDADVVAQALIDNVDLGGVGAQPYCIEGDCAGCSPVEDRGCGGALGQCVDGLCRGCDPTDGAGCSADRPRCDPVLATCVGCEAHADCRGWPDAPFCVEGRCDPCEPGSDQGCAPGVEVCLPSAVGSACVDAACDFTDRWFEIAPAGVTEFHFDTRQQPGLPVGQPPRWSWAGCWNEVVAYGGRTVAARLVLTERAAVEIDLLITDFDAVTQLRRGCDDGVPAVDAIRCRGERPGQPQPAVDYGILDPGVYFVLIGGQSYQGNNAVSVDQYQRGTGTLRVVVGDPGQ